MGAGLIELYLLVHTKLLIEWWFGVYILVTVVSAIEEKITYNIST